jgi:hypothetical protein
MRRRKQPQTHHASIAQLLHAARQQTQKSAVEKQIDVVAVQLIELPVLSVVCFVNFLLALWRYGILIIVVIVVGLIWEAGYYGTIDAADIMVIVLNLLSDVMGGLSVAISAATGALSSAASFFSGGRSPSLEVCTRVYVCL